MRNDLFRNTLNELIPAPFSCILDRTCAASLDDLASSDEQRSLIMSTFQHVMGVILAASLYSSGLILGLRLDSQDRGPFIV